MQPLILFRWITLFGYFGLLIFLALWMLVLEPLPAHEISIKIALSIGPLMLPLRGLLHGQAYTHAWASYLALVYFVAGVWFAAGDDQQMAGLVIVLLSLIFFIGAMFYARYRGRADRLQAEQHQP